jgi:hypothetical protein
VQDPKDDDLWWQAQSLPKFLSLLLRNSRGEIVDTVSSLDLRLTVGGESEFPYGTYSPARIGRYLGPQTTPFGPFSKDF